MFRAAKKHPLTASSRLFRACNGTRRRCCTAIQVKLKLKVEAEKLELTNMEGGIDMEMLAQKCAPRTDRKQQDDEEVAYALRCRKTKIVCTLGPRSRDISVLERLLRAGMNVARFNFSHGSFEYHQEALENLQIAMQNTQIMCAVMLDTKVH